MSKRCLTFLIAAMFLLAGAAATAADEEPSGTIVIDETQVMALLGGTLGEGTLNFRGESQRFKAKGLSLGASIGVHKIHITGKVYNLDNVKDFPGTYVAAEAGETLVKGAGSLWLKNKDGVELHLTSSNKGLALVVAGEGLAISMD